MTINNKHAYSVAERLIRGSRDIYTNYDPSMIRFIIDSHCYYDWLPGCVSRRHGQADVNIIIKIYASGPA